MVKCAVAALTTPAAGCPHCVTPLSISAGSFSLRDGEQSFIHSISSLYVKNIFHMYECFAHIYLHHVHALWSREVRRKHQSPWSSS